MISSISSATSAYTPASSVQDGARAKATDADPSKQTPETPATDASQPKQPGKTSAADTSKIAELAAIDKKVRAHEAAHIAAAHGLSASAASFTYTTGPDGKRYAVGGEVNIDVSPGKTPSETIAKAEAIRSAALAPAEPSGQDRKVAAMAARMAAEARIALSREQADAYSQDKTKPSTSGTRVNTTA